MNTEQKYWKENQFLQDLINLLPYFVFWKNKDSVFLGCNENFARLAGLSSVKEIIGKTDYDLPWSKAESDAYRVDDRFVMESRRPKLNIEETQTLTNGDKKVLLTSKVPLIDYQDTVVGVLATYIDITHLKRKEEELREAKTLAEKSNVVKTQFIQNMSHELRTPLNGILGMAQVLQYSPRLNEEDKDQVSKLIASGQILLQLVNDVLNFSKIEAKKFELHLVELSIRELTAKVIAPLSLLAAEKHLILNTHYSEQCLDKIVSDPLCISQVLTNLIANAIKFTEQGQIDIFINVMARNAQELILQVTVRDTGVGIPKDQFSTIFERFHQVHPSYTQTQLGVGLGLAIVKKLVAEMGGTIQVDSELGKGSTFSLTLPCKAAIQEGSMAEAYDKNLKKVADVNQKKGGKPLRILLVEDNHINQKIMIHMLSVLFDCSIVVASTGQQAIERFNQALDLVLLDIGLPDMTGFEVARVLNEQMVAEHFHVPVISVTAHSDVDRHHPLYQELKFAGALIKPVDMAVLNDLIRKALGFI